MSELLMRLQSNMVLAADVRPSALYVFDDKLAFFGRAGVIGGQEVYLNYDQVAQVNQKRGFIEGSLEIINSGGRDSIVIDHVTNGEAEKAKILIEQRANLAKSGSMNGLPTPPRPSSADSSMSDPGPQPSGVELLDDLARLKDQGILTEEEFEEKKREILGRI